MRSRIIIMMLVVLFCKAHAQSHAGLEQYYYFGKAQDVSLVSIAYYQNAHNWYAEARYNYEERNTVSLYAGKTFNKDGVFSYSVTPMLGLLAGKFNGASAGANIDVTYKDFELSSQIQYVFLKGDGGRDFILNWSELSCQYLPFVKSGLALQQTTVNREGLKMDTGIFVCFSYKNWELPLYVFSPVSKERNYVIGINWEWQHIGKDKNQSPAPSVKGRKRAVWQ